MAMSMMSSCFALDHFSHEGLVIVKVDNAALVVRSMLSPFGSLMVTTLSSFAFVADLQDRVARLPLVETLSFRGWRSGPGGDSLDVQFFGASGDVLKAAAEELKQAINTIRAMWLMCFMTITSLKGSSGVRCGTR